MPPSALKLSSRPEAIAARRRRLAKGQQSEEAVREAAPSIKGLQRMLAFPLLEAIDGEGGAARPGDIYQRLADRLSLPEDMRRETRSCADGSRDYDWFPQQVRWARQTAVMHGLIAPSNRRTWELTERGHEKLGRVRRGTAYLVYSTDLGTALWAHAEDAARVIEPGSIQLVFTSPIYPIAKPRSYGGITPADWLDWMRRLTALWAGLLTDDGVIAINIADSYVPGKPTVSSYLLRYQLACQDDLRLHQLPTHLWHNPTKLPHLQWGAKQRRELRPTVEYILRFAKTPFPKADNRRVLEPYKASTIAQWKRGDRKRKREIRASGYDINPAAFAPTGGGAIPSLLIQAANSSAGDAYSRAMRAQGLPLHPARFPEALPERLIRLHTDVGDSVMDPMAGSGTTAAVAERLGRRWITSEPMLAYLHGSLARFDGNPSLHSQALPPL